MIYDKPPKDKEMHNSIMHEWCPMMQFMEMDECNLEIMIWVKEVECLLNRENVCLAIYKQSCKAWSYAWWRQAITWANVDFL